MKNHILRGVLVLVCLILVMGSISCNSGDNIPPNPNLNPGSLPSLSINTHLSVAEGNSGLTPLAFTVTLSAPSKETVSVDYATADGTATVADNDYQAAKGTLSFSPGQTTQTITIQIVGDTKVEPDETFTVNLTNPIKATIAQAQGQATIAKDDSNTPTCPDGYALIPGDSFMIGSLVVADGDEQPQTQVSITSFCLAKTEVSVGAYKKFLGTNLPPALLGGSCNAQNILGDNYPVVCMTFDEKRAYCQADKGDLPTAAQLHFASRFDVKDNTPVGAVYPNAVLADGDIKVSDLVISNNGSPTTAAPVDANSPTGGTRANRFGVFNLLGNVWESALDAYDSGFYATMSSKDPYNPLTDETTQPEEFGGGSWSDFQWSARPALRIYDNPDYRVSLVGFRCARPLPQGSN